jgi:hypothetical protein
MTPSPLTSFRQQTLEEFDEKLPKMISDLVWAVTDGGQKIESHRFISSQDEPVREFEDIKALLSSALTQQLSLVVEEIERNIAIHKELESQFVGKLTDFLQKTDNPHTFVIEQLSDLLTRIKSGNEKQKLSALPTGE